MTILSRTSTHRSTTTTIKITPRFRWNDNRYEYLFIGVYYIYVCIYYRISFWLCCCVFKFVRTAIEVSVRYSDVIWDLFKDLKWPSFMVTGIGSSGTTKCIFTRQDRTEYTNQEGKEIRFKAIIYVLLVLHTQSFSIIVC